MTAKFGPEQWQSMLERLVSVVNRKGLDADNAFEIAAEVFKEEHFGRESCQCEGTDSECEYLNMGDAYAATLILSDGELSVGCWGDWYENAEREYCEENDTIRCPYCSHLTPMVFESYRDTVCEQCGEQYQ